MSQIERDPCPECARAFGVSIAISEAITRVCQWCGWPATLSPKRDA